MSDYKALADLIFPNAKPMQYRLEKYPLRNTKWIVTRVAPSPTGFMHIGTVYTSIINAKLSTQSDWVFLLRVEDTDQERLVPGAIDLIINWLKSFDINISEWPIWAWNKDVWNYGPYIQSKRKEIYESFAKRLIEQGKAYPCRLVPAELDQIRKQQMSMKTQPGIYGNLSVWRNKTIDEYMTKYKEDTNCVIRFRSHGDTTRKVVVQDLIKWEVSMSDNFLDQIIIKAKDGLPSYHLAHIVDDTLMRTTHIIRADERFVSLPRHLQLFEAFGFTPPIYCHLVPLGKTEWWNKRKLSKRKDPESDLNLLFQQGYPVDALWDYLMSLIDSSFEDWQKETGWNRRIFEISLDRMKTSRILFDVVKLNWFSNNYISTISNQKLYEMALEWAKKYNPETLKLLTQDSKLAMQALSIERLTPTDPKRITKLEDIASQIDRIYDDIWFENLEENKKNISDIFTEKLKYEFLEIYKSSLDLSMSKDVWFDQLKGIWSKLGFASNNAEFKSGNFIWKIGDLAMFLRIMICGKAQTPDLYSVIQILGKDKVLQRLNVK